MTLASLDFDLEFIIQFQSRSMPDPAFSDIDFWTFLKETVDTRISTNFSTIL